MNVMKGALTRAALVALAVVCAAAVAGPTAAAGLKGKYVELKEPSTHVSGKVKMTEFADFYCPHCHLFEQQAVPALKKEFGDKLEITMVGFPVIRGKLPTAFEMYEQARVMGKGPEMKQVLFRTIHKDRLEMLDGVLRAALAKEVGLDPVAFEAGLATGKPAKAVHEGKKLGERLKVESTPTIILDGNIKVEPLELENLKSLIRSILAADTKR